MAEVVDALTAAREAHAAATEALHRAEAAVRAAGLEVGTTVVDELTVKRLNVVEDDGTLRIVIGNSSHGRVAPMRGRPVVHPGRDATAGLLFVNDEGTECGGLQFGGYRRDGGKEQGGFLTFDDYEQNESVRMGQNQRGDVVTKYLEFSDQPAWSLVDLIDETEGLGAEETRTVYERYFGAVDGRGRSRMRLGREEDGSVQLVLRDGRGQDRLRFVVPEDGDPTVEILDADGIPRSLLPD
jgi:hypothetical protein